MVLARWQSTFTDESGNVSAGLSITVREESSGAIASTFSDRDGVASKTSITTDANGYAFFYAAPGRYRIQATGIDWRDVEITQQSDIAQKADLAGGADANFTAMPQVGGDPVVESGSNSDGEWTRWADGTQLCRKSDSTALGAGSLTGGVYVSGGIEIFLAQAFIGQPHGTVGAGAGSATDGFWMTFAASIDSSSGFARAYRNETFTVGDNGTFQVMAIGRWK